MRVLRPCADIVGFYDGRVPRARRYAQENWYDDGALELGICSYAIVSGAEALVYDTHASLDHARFVRRWLEDAGVRTIRVVLSHWHADHVAGNDVFADCPILAGAATAAALAAHRAELQGGVPPISPLRMPDTLHDADARLTVGDIPVALRRLDIHSHDATVLVLPDSGILLAGDTLEDPITYVTEPERLAFHLEDLRRLQGWSFVRILPNHGDPERIGAGGYDRRLVKATIRYVEALLRVGGNEMEDDADLRLLLREEMASGALVYHPAYEAVHRRNREAVRALASSRRARD